MIPWLSLVPGWAWKVGASIVVAFVAFKAIEHRGARKAVAKIEATDAKSVKKAAAAATKSRDPSVGGVLDPNIRPDH